MLCQICFGTQFQNFTCYCCFWTSCRASANDDCYPKINKNKKYFLNLFLSRCQGEMSSWIFVKVKKRETQIYFDKVKNNFAHYGRHTVTKKCQFLLLFFWLFVEVKWRYLQISFHLRSLWYKKLKNLHNRTAKLVNFLELNLKYPWSAAMCPISKSQKVLNHSTLVHR